MKKNESKMIFIFSLTLMLALSSNVFGDAGVYYSLNYMDKSYFSSTENLNLNVYEDNPNTCEGVDPKSSTDCYFSEEVKPVMDSITLTYGWVHKSEFYSRLFATEYNPIFGFGINLHYLNLTGNTDNTYIDAKRFPAVGVEIFHLDPKGFNLYGIKPAFKLSAIETLAIDRISTDYNPLYLTGQNSNGVQKTIRDSASYSEIRGSLILNLGGRVGKRGDLYNYFQIEVTSIIQSKLKFKDRTQSIKGNSFSINYQVLNFD